jgi:FecR protein
MKEAEMSKISAAHLATASLSILLFAATAAAQTSDQSASGAQVTVAPAPSLSTPSVPGASKVRIVRLSEVKGVVRIDRNNGSGLEPAITNLPVVEKNSLETETGTAEVEFEDNSSLRLAPDSAVEFPTLERMPGGTTVSSVRLVKGMAYVSLMKTAGNEFNLLFGQQSVRLQPASHVRLQLEGDDAKLAVLDGNVQIEGPMGVMDVAHKQTVTLSLAGGSEPTVAKNVESNSFDSWDKNSAEYHQRYSNMSAFNGSPYSYGVSDMNYYGAFSDFGGCGMMWRPYFASAAWDPYANGTWAWYQGAGYSWVSPYPWGWMPYNYGAWNYCPGVGYGWMPGGDWMGLNNMAFLGSPGFHGPGRMPVRPVHPPMHGAGTLIGVNEKPLIRSSVASPTSFVFRKDSAGFGIPREELGKLNKFSERTVARGETSTQIYMEMRSVPGGRGEPGRPGYAVATMHRGTPAPIESRSGGFEGGMGNRGVSSTSTASSSMSSAHGSSGGSSGGSHH